MPLVKIDERTCIRCNACAAACGATIIVPRKEAPPRLYPGADRSCLRCGHCVAVCPTGSVSHAEMPAESFLPVEAALEASFDQLSRLVRDRRSVREFREEAPPRAEIERVIETARCAPTGHNLQEVSWIVVEGREAVRALAAVGLDWARSIVERKDALAREMKGILKMSGYGVDIFLRDAPALVLACAERGNPMGPTDCAIAMCCFDLAAKAAGMGGFWNGYFAACARDYAPMARALGMPEGLEVDAAFCLGYPLFEYRLAPPRRPARAEYR
jgi:nitroreductase/NAD-dependent dihydropyrimidine dehydrogenase PreA subunit